jgi:hypothetical protein
VVCGYLVCIFFQIWCVWTKKNLATLLQATALIAFNCYGTMATILQELHFCDCRKKVFCLFRSTAVNAFWIIFCQLCSSADYDLSLISQSAKKLGEQQK